MAEPQPGGEPDRSDPQPLSPGPARQPVRRRRPRRVPAHVAAAILDALATAPKDQSEVHVNVDLSPPLP